MFKKKLVIVSSFIVCSLLLGQIAPSSALSFPMTDGGNDVVKAVNVIYHSQGDYKDEIDIVSVDLVGTDIEITFQATPIIDGYHFYLIYIHWDGDEETTNLSSCLVGNVYGSVPENVVSTVLFNSTGWPVALTSVDDVASAASSKLTFPVLNYSLIQNPTNPHTLQVWTQTDVGDLSETWYDWYPDELNTEYAPTDTTTPTDTTSDNGFPTSLPFSGLTIAIATVGLSVATITFIVIRKKRK